MISHNTRDAVAGVQPVQPQPVVGFGALVAAVEARVSHLEAALEGLQDAVYRKSILEDRQIAELSRRTEPHEMARALSEDARRHGL